MDQVPQRGYPWSEQVTLMHPYQEQTGQEHRPVMKASVKGFLAALILLLGAMLAACQRAPRALPISTPEEAGLSWQECAVSALDLAQVAPCLGTQRPSKSVAERARAGVRSSAGLRLTVGGDTYETRHLGLGVIPAWPWDPYVLLRNGRPVSLLFGEAQTYDPDLSLQEIAGQAAWEFADARQATIIYGGRDLRRAYGLEAAYAPYELGGRLAFIGKQGGHCFLVYDGRQVGPAFDEIAIAYCCETSLYSAGGGEGRYRFWGRRGDQWYVVEVAAPVAANSPASTAVPGATGQPTPTGAATSATPWPWPAELLFQPGDLPEGIRAGQLDTAIPEYMRDKYTPPDAAAGLTLACEGVQGSCGQVHVFAYDDAARLQTAYRQLVGAAGMASGPQGVPVPRLGRQAVVFPAASDLVPVRLYLQACRSLVEVRLTWPDAEPALLAYAARLARRLDAVQCQGVAAVPILSPAPLQPTPTPVPTVAVAQAISPTVERLPDPEGANLIRAYAFADAAHGWLRSGAALYYTEDGGRSWQQLH